MNRRQFLFTAGALGASYAAFRYWPDTGIFNPCLNNMPASLKQNPLMQTIWSDIDPKLVWDCHMHIVGTGDSDSGIWFNNTMSSWAHPILKIQKQFYENGACTASDNQDISAIERIINLSQAMPTGYKSMLFAFDWFHDEQGQPVKDRSIFHIPNQYGQTLASKHSQLFEWVASIHPYRADAVDALAQAKEQGARAIKWLPPGMGIDPASPKCDAFYKKAAELKLPIITHTGSEHAVQGSDHRLGNPLKLRRALDQGVTVVMAHSATTGNDEDFDNGNKRVKSFTLFSRLMDTPDYSSLAFGEISALTLINHAWAIKTMLQRTDWHHRLINGSDYPLPAIMPLTNTRQLHQLGFIDSEHLPFLQELKLYNPLLYNFAVKRLIQFNNSHFDKSVFETRRLFDQTIV